MPPHLDTIWAVQPDGLILIGRAHQFFVPWAESQPDFLTEAAVERLFDVNNIGGFGFVKGDPLEDGSIPFNIVRTGENAGKPWMSHDQLTAVRYLNGRFRYRQLLDAWDRWRKRLPADNLEIPDA